MKKFKFFGMALFAAMLSFSVTSCSSGDDDLLGDDGTSQGTTTGGQSGTQASSYAGTTWKVVSASGQASYWNGDFTGYTAHFNNDGSMTITPTSAFTYAKWEQNGNELRLTFGKGKPQQVLVMNITNTSATTATADCYWEAVDGKTSDKYNPSEHGTFVLQKQ